MAEASTTSDGIEDLVDPLFAAFANEIRRGQLTEIDGRDRTKPRAQRINRRLPRQPFGTVDQILRNR
ncbi:MAG: hypothetical protein QOH21_3625 [Acidobacteriota bacterium]|nr:hypothetical protein [Acidobacteriota bacterium]